MLTFKAKAPLYIIAGALLVPCILPLRALQNKAWAQPTAVDSQVKAAWDKLQADSLELEATDPKGAIARYQKFFEETGHQSPSTGIKIALRIAGIYQGDLKNYDKAIEIYDWARSLYKDQPEIVVLQKRRLAAIESQNRVENVGTGKEKFGVTLPSTDAATQTLSIGAPAMPPPSGDALGWRHSPTRCITALAQQTNGTLWVATEESGVWWYDPSISRIADRWRQFTAKDGLADESAYALAVDQKGRVWAGTLNHGVSVWNGKQWKNYGVLDGPLGERVFDIAVCPTDGDVWIATNAGLTRYSQQKDSWSTVTRADGLPSDQIQAIAFDKDGNIVLGTQCDGVALAQAADSYKTWRVVKGPDQMPLTATGQGLPTSLINDVLVGRDGTIYAATTTGLAWSSDGGENWSYVRGQDYAAKVRGLYGGAPVGWREGPGAVLAEDYVSCLAQDEAGRPWVGHWKAGSEMVQMQSGPAGLRVTQVSSRKESGLVKAMLSQSNGAPLLARYNEGLSYGGYDPVTVDSAIVNMNEEPSKAATINPPTALPTAAKAPTLGELNAMLSLLGKVDPLDAKSPVVTELSDDWTTQGDWLGRYGRYYARLHAMLAPYDYVWGAGIEAVPFKARIGKNVAAGDSIRYWVHQLYTSNPKSLEMPQIYYDSRLKKALTPSQSKSALENRRQAELDDHGEVYPMTQDGPNIFVTLAVPKGNFYLSFYDFNENGEAMKSRLRDYSLSLRTHPDKVALSDIDGFEKWPELAHGRVHDFRGGVYKRFLVRGPQTLTLQVNRNYSFNTMLTATFLDEVTEEPEPYFAPPQSTLVALEKNGGVASDPAEKAVDEIWQQLERTERENPAWWGTESRGVYARLLPWLEDARLRATDDKIQEIYQRIGTCYYQLCMFEQWEEFQKRRGLTPAREIEKSLMWDGKSNSSGQERISVLSAIAESAKITSARQ